MQRNFNKVDLEPFSIELVLAIKQLSSIFFDPPITGLVRIESNDTTNAFQIKIIKLDSSSRKWKSCISHVAQIAPQWKLAKFYVHISAT